MTRVLSGVILAAAALAAILFLPPVGLRILASAIALLAAHEYLRLVGSEAALAGLAFGVVLTVWMVAGRPEYGFATAAIVALFSAGLTALLPQQSSRQGILNAFSLLYIALPLGLLVHLQDRFGWRGTMLLVATVVVSDSSQFYAGRAFGRRPLAPAISPKKTIEGAVGGLVAGTAFMGLAGTTVFPDHSWVALAALGLVIVVFGIAGDLFESRLKREANVKDSSSLIPGHGGVLDRIDALLFVIPVFYAYATGTT